jgi:hypothetical protein
MGKGDTRGQIQIFNKRSRSVGEFVRSSDSEKSWAWATYLESGSCSLFSDREIMGLCTQGDEKRLLFSHYSPWKHRPPLCHLDRSAAQWRDLRFSASSLEVFCDRGIWAFGPPKLMKRLLFSNHSHLEAPPFPLSSRPKRSAVERSAVRRLLLGSVFRQRDLGLRPTEADETASVQQPLSPGSTALPFVISTEAYPDFLLRGTYQGYGCGFP